MATKKVRDIEDANMEEIKADIGTEGKSEAKEAKKTTARKPAAKKNIKSSVTIQIEGRDISSDELVKRAKKEFKKLRKGVDIKSLDVYVNVHEAKAYYVVNKESAPEFCLDI